MKSRREGKVELTEREDYGDEDEDEHDDDARGLGA